MEDYQSINKDAWNKRTEYHVDSEFYDMPSFLDGKNSLKEIELPLLGDVKGKLLLHLQCHFGQDTLSLARMGAHVTGIDLSDQAINKANQLTKDLGLEAKFHCCDVYDTPQVVNNQFDIVFTSYGTIGWLPDLDKWANTIKQCLKPGGKFIFADFHPVVWMFDDDFKGVAYKYSKSEPIVEDLTGSYAAEENFETKSVSWNHGIGEVLQALMNQGLQLEHFSEYHYSPYNCFRGTEEIEPGKFIIKSLGDKIPMVYAIVASN